MSTKYIASNWRLLNQENSGKSDNYGLSFNGSNEYIDLNIQSLTTPATISMWVNTAVNDSQQRYALINGRADQIPYLFLRMTTDNTYQVLFYNSNGSDTLQGSFATINTWFHFVIVCKDSQTLLYENGVLKDTSSTGWNGVNINQSNNWQIGRDSRGMRFWSGSISECAFFDYALSESQISTLYGSSSLGAGNPMALKPQPVAYYPLGDNSASNPLTQPNEAVEDASVFDFDGTDYIDIGSQDELKNITELSISLWFNYDSIQTSADGLVSRDSTSRADGNWYIALQSNQIRFLLKTANGQDALNSSTISANKWYHTLCVWNGTTMKIYLDGSLDNSITLSNATGTLGSASDAVRIAKRIFGSNEYNGKISNIAIWNSDQSSEALNIYNSGVPATSYTNTPTAWYKLDQSANWEADTSGAWQIPDAVSAYPQSFDFDGSSQIINLGNDASLYPQTGDMSYSFWINPDVLSGYQTIYGLVGMGTSVKGVNIELFGSEVRVFMGVGVSGQWGVNTGGGTGGASLTTSSSGLTVGQWTHIAVTLDRDGNGVIYINGVANVTAAMNPNDYSAVDIVSSSDILIGNGNGYLNGKTSNVQVWNSNLSASQVLQLYNNGVPLTTAIASDNLQAWYKLDNTATFSTNWSIPDASGNGNTGTSLGMTEQNLVNNNVSVLNGESSGMSSASLVLSDLSRNVPYDIYSFNFDSASSDYIDCGDSDTFSFGNGSTDSPFSVSFWLNFASFPTTFFAIIAKDFNSTTREWGIGALSTSKKLRFFLKNNGGGSSQSIDTTTTFSTGQWHHITCTYNGVGGVNAADGMEIYVNGIAETPTNVTKQTYTAMANTTAPLTIGTYQAGGSPLPFDGKLSNVSIFNEELTSTEVLKLYSNGVPQDLANFTPAPVAWYPLGSNSFWNGSQWTVRDMSTGGSNDGTGQNIGVDGLVGDAPRSEANGTGTNMDVPTNLEGSTKWSSNNSWSINMSSEARTTDVP